MLNLLVLIAALFATPMASLEDSTALRPSLRLAALPKGMIFFNQLRYVVTFAILLMVDCIQPVIYLSYVTL